MIMNICVNNVMGPASLHIDPHGHMSHIQFHTTADTRFPTLVSPSGQFLGYSWSNHLKSQTLI